MDDPINRRAALKQMAVAATIAGMPTFFGTLSAQVTSSQPKPDDRELATMRDIATQFMARFKVPGLSVAIARHGDLVYQEAFGMADEASGEKVTASHRFRIASISKPITSVTIFSLIENSRLNLHDLVFGAKGILQFDYGSSYPAPVEKITIEHLLTHTCGGWSNEKNDPMVFDATLDARALIKWTVQNIPLQAEPGKQFAYSNFGYCILGRVLEKVTGQPYVDFVRENVLTKCDVIDMQIAGNTLAEKAPGEVTYYGQNGDEPYAYNIRRMDSHGGWIATPGDLVKFAMRVDGFSYVPNILEKSTIRTMTTPTSLNPLYAKGWSVTSQPNWWHSGVLPGTMTIMVRTASGLCWAAFTNTRTEGMMDGLDNMMWSMVGAVPVWNA